MKNLSGFFKTFSYWKMQERSLPN